MATSNKGIAASPKAAKKASTLANAALAKLAKEQSESVMTQETSALITAFVAHDESNRVKRGAVLDALQASNANPDWFKSPADDAPAAHKAYYAALKTSVAAGITTFKDPTDLSRKVGSKIKDLRNGLLGRIEKEKAIDEGGASERSTLESRIARDCAKFIAQVEKASDFKGNKESCLAGLKTAIKSIKI